MRRLVFVLPVVIGCSYDATGQGSGTSEGSGSAASTTTTTTADTTTTGGPEGSSTTVVIDGSGSSGVGSTTETPPATDTSSTGEPPPTARSCAEILEQDPSAPTGVHSIVRERDGAVIEVHCEMELDDGGWTLVARSEQGADVPFGWGVAQGMLGDDTAPYSLDAMDLGLPFTEILITRRMGFATPTANAYVVDVPLGFLEDYRDQAYETGDARTVLGGCTPQGGPDMLRWVGYTDDTENYFFRDYSGNDQWGLFPNEIRTYYDDCNRGGDLNEEQGALFVR